MSPPFQDVPRQAQNIGKPPGFDKENTLRYQMLQRRQRLAGVVLIRVGHGWVFSIKAPVGQACTHSPHTTQDDNPIGSFQIEHGQHTHATPAHTYHVIDLFVATGAFT